MPTNIPHQNWQSLGASGLWGTYTAGNNAPVVRSQLDEVRINGARVPSAEYPDGYLGNVGSRRSDRLLDSVKNRVTQKSYQRGVHKGERIDPGDYIWPSSMKPERGIALEAKGKKFAPIATIVPAPQLVNDGKTGHMSTIPVEINERRKVQMQRLAPTWR